MKSIEDVKIGKWYQIVTLNSPSRGLMKGIVGHKFQAGSIDGDYVEATAETSIIGLQWPYDCIKPCLPPNLTVMPIENKEKLRQLINTI